ncbi:hypothetical protein [Streptomyces sp. NPDC005438]|uniref:hypothetical protein n=1 Tax=Streptomyces sp. NPDC005438 TaxID=3156880 RepID=UPI0033AC5F67
MSIGHEKPEGLPTLTQHLETLATRLRHSDQRVPEISAARDALTCAALLLRTQQHHEDATLHTDLLHEAVGVARSVVETTKYACRARTGIHRAGTSSPVSVPSPGAVQGGRAEKVRD